MRAQFINSQSKIILLALISCIGYWVFAYATERSDFESVISIYCILFIIFLYTVKLGKYNFWLLVVLAICYRFVFYFATPNLSQDFYRFIWDGRLLAQGMNPYLTTPFSYMQEGSTDIVPQAKILYKGMGLLNASNYTNYPPVNQLLFLLAGVFSGKSIIGAVAILRTTIILADLGILFFGVQLLKKLKLPSFTIFYYALNPFIIIEMTGNLHFEPVMLFFLVVSLYMLASYNWMGSALFMGFSIATKLLPLLLLPLFLQYFLTKGGKETTHFRSSYPLQVRFRESIKNIPTLSYYYLIVLGVVILSFLPFLSQTLFQNYAASIELWFKKFEFNASVYYIIRSIGFKNVGYNIIGTAGPLLSKVVLTTIVFIAFIRNNRSLKNMICGMLFSVCIYFLLATTVHPWYVATPLFLSVFTKYKFPLVWSFTVMLSYAAYASGLFDENLWFVAVEYAVVIGYFIWELSSKSKNQVNKSPYLLNAFI